VDLRSIRSILVCEKRGASPVHICRKPLNPPASLFSFPRNEKVLAARTGELYSLGPRVWIHNLGRGSSFYRSGGGGVGPTLSECHFIGATPAGVISIYSVAQGIGISIFAQVGRTYGCCRYLATDGNDWLA